MLIELLAKIGASISTMCVVGWFDEPEMPKSMLRK